MVQLCSKKLNKLKVDDDDWNFYTVQYSDHVGYVQKACAMFKSMQPEANKDVAEMIGKELVFYREQHESEINNVNNL